MRSRHAVQLLSILDQAYDRRSWHGTTLRGSIRGVTLEAAAWRPASARHNVWELVVHAAYWKYVVRRRLRREPPASFPLRGSNWFRRPNSPDEKTTQAWRTDVALLDQMHADLREAIADFPANRLDRPAHGGRDTNFALISGIAAHDLYHAGQIQLLKRLYTDHEGLKGTSEELRAKR